MRFAGFVGENNSEENGGSSDPIGADIVADAHDVGGQSLGDSLDTGRYFARADNTASNTCHNSIIARLETGRGVSGAGQEELFGFFESFYGERAGDGGESFKEINGLHNQWVQLNRALLGSGGKLDQEYWPPP